MNCVDMGGFEPPTSKLSAWRSNLLNYISKLVPDLYYSVTEQGITLEPRSQTRLIRSNFVRWWYIQDLNLCPLLSQQRPRAARPIYQDIKFQNFITAFKFINLNEPSTCSLLNVVRFYCLNCLNHSNES